MAVTGKDLLGDMDVTGKDLLGDMAVTGEDHNLTSDEGREINKNLTKPVISNYCSNFLTNFCFLLLAVCSILKHGLT